MTSSDWSQTILSQILNGVICVTETLPQVRLFVNQGHLTLIHCQVASIYSCAIIKVLNRYRMKRTTLF